MKRFIYINLISAGAILSCGCDGGGLTPNQKAQANKQWNDARGGVLATLAAAQFQEGNLEKCQETLSQAIRLEPANADLHLMGAKLSIEQGNLEAAHSQLEEARRLNPKNAEVDYLSGVVLQRWQQPDKARESYAAAFAKNPGELSYLLAQAEMLVVVGRPAEALSLLQAKTILFEHSGTIRDEIGQLLIAQNQIADGITELRKATLLASDDLSICEHLAIALYADKQFAESGECIQRLLRDSDFAKRADLQAMAGECEFQLNQFEEAKNSFQSATKLDPNCCGYWMSLAKANLQLNDLADAETAARKTVSIDTHSSRAQSLLGYVSLRQVRLPQSLAAFEAAGRLDPQDTVSLSLEGYVLQRMGRKAEANARYEKAHQMNPNDVLANRLITAELSN